MDLIKVCYKDLILIAYLDVPMNLSCIFNPLASIDDGSCEYIEQVNLGSDTIICNDSYST